MTTSGFWVTGIWAPTFLQEAVTQTLLFSVVIAFSSLSADLESRLKPPSAHCATPSCLMTMMAQAKKRRTSTFARAKVSHCVSTKWIFSLTFQEGVRCLHYGIVLVSSKTKQMLIGLRTTIHWFCSAAFWLLQNLPPFPGSTFRILYDGCLCRFLLRAKLYFLKKLFTSCTSFQVNEFPF